MSSSSQNSPRPIAQPGVTSIAHYVAGKSKAAPGVVSIKLSANESPLGTSPKAIAAFEAQAKRIDLYPDSMARDLRAALAQAHGIDAERIVCGNGSDDLLHLLAQAYLGDGDDAVMSQYGFAIYPVVVRGAGANVVVAQERDYRSDVDALLAAVTPKTKVLFLANPNNPTGSYLPESEIERLHAGLRSDILFVLDSAYADYATAENYDAGISLVERSDNVVMVRTFSKVGLAAARVGWCYGPDHVSAALNRLRGPFNVNGPGMAAAIATLEDEPFNAALRSYNDKWRAWLSGALNSNQIRVLPSQGNFVLALFADAVTANAAFIALFDKGLIVREMSMYGIGNGLRITIGPEAGLRALVEVLEAFGAPGERMGGVE